TRLPPTSSTVTGTTPPSANTRVMPIFLPISPSAIVVEPDIPALTQLDFDVHAGRQVELHERVHGLVGRLDDVHDPLVRADLELIARLLVRVRRALQRVALDLGRQRN